MKIICPEMADNSPSAASRQIVRFAGLSAVAGLRLAAELFFAISHFTLWVKQVLYELLSY